MEVEEEACCGRTWRVSHEKAWRVVVKRNEKVMNVLVAVVVEGPLGLLEVGVEHLHVTEAAGGTEVLAVIGLGWEAEGQSGFVGVEGSEQRDWSLEEEAGVPVCQVEVGEVQLLCAPPF